jgi:cation diffusion facilitator family transporter
VQNDINQKKLLSGLGGIKFGEGVPEVVESTTDAESEPQNPLHDHDHHHDHEEENINIRAAVVHVIGDMLQSIGVIIAAVLIYIWPETKIADPICTYLFSILVIITTIPVFKDCMRILMESTPKGIDTSKIRNKIMEVEGVQAVTDLHVWSLAGNKNILTAHI